MLIIFDLDDTLIDTSGCITPIKLEDALQRMSEAGLQFPDRNEALEMLKRLNATADSARIALAEFLEIHDADSRFLEIGLKEIYDNISPDIPVFPLDEALETLTELALIHQMALVSVGKPEQQLAKMKKAGIDSAFFSKIAITEERNKGLHYQAIVDELGLQPSEVIVCGDRIGTDLTPARELGYKTIHMRWGRGMQPVVRKSDVDYTVSRFREIKEIISGLMHFADSKGA